MVSGLLGVQSQAVACVDGRLNVGGVSARLDDEKSRLEPRLLKKFDPVGSERARERFLSDKLLGSTSLGSTRIVIQNSSKPLSLSATQSVELSRLLRDRDVATSVYANLATQAAQSKIASQSPSEGAQPISLAAEPANPTQPKPLQNVAIAAVVGLMLSVFGAFGAEYFAAPRKPRAI